MDSGKRAEAASSDPVRALVVNRPPAFPLPSVSFQTGSCRRSGGNRGNGRRHGCRRRQAHLFALRSRCRLLCDRRGYRPDQDRRRSLVRRRGTVAVQGQGSRRRWTGRRGHRRRDHYRHRPSDHPSADRSAGGQAEQRHGPLQHRREQRDGRGQVRRHGPGGRRRDVVARDHRRPWPLRDRRGERRAQLQGSSPTSRATTSASTRPTPSPCRLQRWTAGTR